MSNCSDHQERINQFMRLAEQEIPPRPIVPDEKVRQLRATLILEEACETIQALGGTVYYNARNQKLEILMNRTPNLVEIVDGCADVSVVTIGTLSACGVEDSPILVEVDRANLKKFGPGSYRREDGKWIKPPDFKAPDIEKELRLQGWKL